MADSFRDRVRGAKKPKFWIPKNEGDFLTGVVKGFRAITSKFGDGEVMEVLDDEAKELTAVFLSSVIRTARETQDIKKGDHVGIKFLGVARRENGDYKDFIVMVDGKEQEGGS